VWVVGEPVLAEVARAAAPRLVERVALPVLACVLLGCVVLLGWRRTTAALVAAVAAGLGTVALASWTGTLALPWTAVAALTGMLLAAALVAAVRVDWRPVGGAAVGALAGLGAGAALAPGAERALADGLLVAIPLGGLAALGARVAFGLVATAVRARRGRRVALAVVAAVLAVGATQLRPGFALAGYGQRYLPASVAPDLGAMARLFPPPQSLALRVRGAPGFVASPAVLHALEAVAGAAAADPKVRHAMSIADLVKIVNRSFHEGRSEFTVVPDDRGLIARYLALAYSPGFRRFVDRALDAAALWITIDGAGPGDLRRIEARVDRALAARPVPDATVDRFGGDGAVTLAMAASGRRVAVGAAGVLVLALLGVLVAGGSGRAARALTASALAGIAVAGLLGWCGQALDLVTVPLLAGVVLVAAVAGGRTRPVARG
jgi:hypothetical protein